MSTDNPFDPGDSESPNSQNPYSPAQDPSVVVSSSPGNLSDVVSRGMVGQVQILGVLMIVQGILMALMAVGIAFYAFFMPSMLEAMQQQAAAQGGNAPTPMPPEFGPMMMIGGSILGTLIFALGAATVYCGFRTTQFRNRMLSMVVLCAGLLTAFTCYCLPTQLALVIYGLIVLLNGPVVEAFRFVDQGHSARDVQSAYLSRP
ncbi:hypothetical protein CA13_36610 [Planctomycetes bacterium CA13]|uniref:DUF4064 domain-containing protein n=1 Tax=Novipirellula herctigrandis TaxID=2527986 RepID=A0A5C5Z4S7_9BACT|nr:hypothetical protein CA13_36610 [Planctomycetes bacterium CA13]